MAMPGKTEAGGASIRRYPIEPGRAAAGHAGAGRKDAPPDGNMDGNGHHSRTGPRLRSERPPKPLPAPCGKQYLGWTPGFSNNFLARLAWFSSSHYRKTTTSYRHIQAWHPPGRPPSTECSSDFATAKENMSPSTDQPIAWNMADRAGGAMAGTFKGGTCA